MWLFLLFLLLLVATRGRLLLLLLASKSSDDVAGGVKEGQREPVLWLIPQEVMNNRPIGRILSSIKVLLHLFASSYLMLAIRHHERTEEGEILARGCGPTIAGRCQEAHSWARLKEMHSGLAYLIADLTQGRNIIE